MIDPIRAEPVIAEEFCNTIGCDDIVDRLLAHGSEHGVAILADGTLRPLTEGEASDA